MKYKTRYNLSHVTSMDALLKEQNLVRQRLKNREEELRMKLYEVPAELAAAGANSLIPRIFRGKLTEAALNSGKKLLNNFIVPKQEGQNSLLGTVVKNKGLFSLVKKGFSLWKGK